MIVMNDKVPQTQNIDASLIQMTVLGDADWPLCNSETTYTGSAKASPSETSPAESCRQLTEAHESTDAQAGLARLSPERSGEAANERTRCCGEVAAEENTEGDKTSEGTGTRSYKRKLECGGASEWDLPKQFKAAECERSNRVFHSNVPLQAGETREVPNQVSNEPGGREEKVEAAGDADVRPSGTPDQTSAVISTPEYRATRRHHDLARGLTDAGVCLRPGLAYPLARGQGEGSICPAGHGGIAKGTDPSCLGRDGHNGEASDQSVRPSFPSHCAHASRYQLEGTLGALTENLSDHQSVASLLANHRAPLNSDSDAQNFRQKGWQSHCPKSSCQPSPGPPSTTSSSTSTAHSNASKADPSTKPSEAEALASYNGSEAKAGYHRLYHLPSPSPAHRGSLGTSLGIDTSAYPPMNVHLPHFFNANANAKLARVHPPSLLTMSPHALDSAYGANLALLASNYNFYHPKHLQAPSPVQLSAAAYSHLNLYPVMWQSMESLDMRCAQPVLTACSHSHPSYLNGEASLKMGIHNPWLYHHLHIRPDSQQRWNQFCGKKEYLTALDTVAHSPQLYKEEVRYADSLCRYPHGIRSHTADSQSVVETGGVVGYGDQGFEARSSENRSDGKPPGRSTPLPPRREADSSSPAVRREAKPTAASPTPPPGEREAADPSSDFAPAPERSAGRLAPPAAPNAAHKECDAGREMRSVLTTSRQAPAGSVLVGQVYRCPPVTAEEPGSPRRAPAFSPALKERMVEPGDGGDCRAKAREGNSLEARDGTGGVAVHRETMTNGTTASAVKPASADGYYTPKKHKAARAATQCPAEGRRVGEGGARREEEEEEDEEVGPPGCGQTAAATASGGHQPRNANPTGCHTKLKKAWLTRHSEQGGACLGVDSSSERLVPEGVGQEVERATKRPLAKRTHGVSQAGEMEAAESKRCLKARGEGQGPERVNPGRQRTPVTHARRTEGAMVVEEEEEGEREKEEEPRVAQTRSRRLERENGVLQNGGLPLPVLKDLQRVKQLKSTGASFIQDIVCADLSANIQRCRECWPGRSRKGVEWLSAPAPCRFLHFRRLSFNRSGGLRVDGYCTEDQVNEEVRARGAPSSPEPDLDAQTSTYLLAHLGDPFCALVSAEQQLFARIAEDYEGSAAMKLTVGERDESCDCCHHTLFNFHWLCLRCGFLVCVQCYMAKLGRGPTHGGDKSEESPTWLKCVKGQVHDIKSLRPTQLVSKHALVSLSEAMHNTRKRWNIRESCVCVSEREKQSLPASIANGLSQDPVEPQDTPRVTEGAPSPPRKITPDQRPGEESESEPIVSTAVQSSLHWVMDLAMQKTKEEKMDVKPDPKAPTKPSEQPSTLCDLLTTTAGKLRVGSIDAGIAFAPVYSTRCYLGTQSVPSILDDIIASVVEKKIPMGKPGISRQADAATFPIPGPANSAPKLSQIPHSLSFSKGLFLWLHDARSKDNWKLMQESWRQSLPVLVSGPLKATRGGLWSPETLGRFLGEDRGTLVNCRDQRAMPRAKSKEFWEGFKSDSLKSPKAKAGAGKILRLDYCCSEKDFSQRFPAQFEDFQKHLPVPEYTENSGRLNLVSRFPGESAGAQLRFKLSCAYGLNSENCRVGTTNLNSQTFDSVNLLMHSQEAPEARETIHKAILKRLEGDQLDEFLLKRLTDSTQRLGAVWHIFAAQDRDRIREFLLKVSDEVGQSLGARHKDQGWYLDHQLRRRLREECNVHSITVLQFQGDAVLIPATALHQVQCVTACVSVAKAFLSPENLTHAIGAVQTPRTDGISPQQTHILQVRSALYRAIRDAVRSLASHSRQPTY